MGGLDVIETIITSLPYGTPPILIAQHLSRDISHTFIPKIQQLSKLKISIAKDGEIIESNHIYFAPFDKHLSIKKECQYKD